MESWQLPPARQTRFCKVQGDLPTFAYDPTGSIKTPRPCAGGHLYDLDAIIVWVPEPLW